MPYTFKRSTLGYPKMTSGHFFIPGGRVVIQKWILQRIQVQGVGATHPIPKYKNKKQTNKKTNERTKNKQKQKTKAKEKRKKQIKLKNKNKNKKQKQKTNQKTKTKKKHIFFVIPNLSFYV